MYSYTNAKTIRLVFIVIGMFLIVLQFTNPHTYTVSTETEVHVDNLYLTTGMASFFIVNAFYRDSLIFARAFKKKGKS